MKYQRLRKFTRAENLTVGMQKSRIVLGERNMETTVKIVFKRERKSELDARRIM